jgi:transcriptional regulator with XRE-family HTH domain
MKDRIKLYIDNKGITAGELAVMLDVQRSNISHILNGRNKPGAAFIEKLLLVFPDLNARWLFTGIGNMVEGEVVPVEREANTLPFDQPTTPVEKIQKEPEIKKEEIISTPLPMENGDQLDKMILLFKDGTFITYNNRTKE